MLTAMEAIMRARRASRSSSGERRLLGSVTDGYVRRALLRGLPLSPSGRGHEPERRFYTRAGRTAPSGSISGRKSAARCPCSIGKEGSSESEIRGCVLSLRRDIGWSCGGGRGTRSCSQRRAPESRGLPSATSTGAALDPSEKQGFTNIFIRSTTRAR